MSMQALLLSLLVLAGGALASLATGRRSWAASLVGALTASVGSCLCAAAALATLFRGAESFLSLPWAVPGASFSLHLDGLCAFFLLLLSLIGLCCSLFGAANLREEGRHRALGSHWFFFNLLLASMVLVVTAANGVLFLAAWELMTLSSFFLVSWDHAHVQVRRAALLYLLVAHCGLVLLLGFFLQAGKLCGSLDFDRLAPLAQLSPAGASVLFLLALGGFGVKAGLFPLHVWLPDAHPAAPSHVSALMSAVLVKMGLYGLLRVLSLLPPAPAWWGWMLALLGALGALYGIALASVQRDVKRCLAYSTIENVGIIVLGLGFTLAAAAAGRLEIALLCGAGALMHLWNHALFKGLLFLGAGALVHAAGTRDMDRMGGLLRRMPRTGMLWIGGSLAAGALPPFNGLAGEWLIYLGFLKAGKADGLAAMAPMLLTALLGLVGAVALLTFARLCGICLLGEPRDEAAALAKEPSALMLAPMAALLAGCLAAGLAPSWVVQMLNLPLSLLLRSPADLRVPSAVQSLGFWGLGLLAAAVLFFALLARLKRLRPLAKAPTWGCGFVQPSARMSYTAEGFSELCAGRMMPRALRPEVRGGVVEGLFPGAARLEQRSLDPVLQRSLRPLFGRLTEGCLGLRWLQLGQLSAYLLYIFATAVVLMAWVFLWERGG